MVCYISCISFPSIEFFLYLDVKVSPPHTSALGGAPITGTKLPSKRKLAVNEVRYLF